MVKKKKVAEPALEEQMETPAEEDVEQAVSEIEMEEPREQSDDEVFDPKKDKKFKQKFDKKKLPLSEAEQKKKKHKKIAIIISIIVVVLAGAGVGAYFLFFYHPNTVEEVIEPERKEPEKPKYYSNFTGLEIADEALNSKPLFCVQVPNGTDGARPQVGLNEAGVVFEAIAEAGITRFAAIYQNPENSVIGPIRSLRSYYLSWDTPFDCTVVHAGGSSDASAQVSSGKYRDLNESYVYMWRDYSSYWAPNNLMTSPELLSLFNSDSGYASSNPAVFPRMKPAEANEAVRTAREKAGLDAATQEAGKIQETEKTGDAETKEAKEVKEVVPLVKLIDVNFGYVDSFNVRYTYDEETNSYLRAYQNGQEHISYTCPVGLEQPNPKSDCGIAKQLSPSVVIAMMVDEYLDTDAYHQVIQTIGSGIAYIFQNGTATKGTWAKNNIDDQITFKDASGNIISFTPGQMFISALPNSTGSVKY